MKNTIKQPNTVKRSKAKRIWNRQHLRILEDRAQQAEIRMLLRLTINDKITEGDLPGAIDFLQGFSEDNNDVYHWPMVQLCAIYALLRDYDKALKFVTNVLYHYDRCQFAQYYFASVLFDRGQPHDAIEIWERIVTMGAAKVAGAKCDCGEGFEWAENLVADCKCALGVAYGATGRDTEAKYWFGQYEQDKRRGRSGLLVWEDDEE